MDLRDPGKYRRVVEDMVASANLELIPLRGAVEQLRSIPLTTMITVTCSPRFGLQRTLEFAELAARAGYEVVPHLAARQVVDRGELRRLVSRLDDCGIGHLYVVGGDAPEPAGRYGCALDLLRDLAEIDHNIGSVGVACYPEGHPSIPDDALQSVLDEKQAYATYMISQLCFDVTALRSWLDGIRASGISLPLHLGLAAPLKSRKLMELSLKIGVGSSLRYLSKQHGMARNLLFGGSYRPEKLLYQLRDDLGSPERNITQLHMFTFNQVEATTLWQQRMSARAQLAAG